MDNILTIIIPCYNCENTIEKTLQSIIELKNIEIILVDDGSIDNTKNIIKKYLNYMNIKYLYQENTGPGSARNKGIKNATGRYIMFLDSDDYVETKNLEELINNYLLKEDNDVIYYNFDQILDNGNIYKSYHLEKFKNLNNQELIKNTISWNLPWGQFKVVRKEIVIKNNIFFESKLKNSEELFFTINILEKSKNILFYDKVIYKYLRRENSISRMIDAEEIKKTINFIFDSLYKKYKKTEYANQIYNYYVISNMNLLREWVLNNDYKNFKKTCTNIRELKKKVDNKYISKRYKYILKLITLYLDFLLYFILIYVLRRTNGSRKKV